MSPGNNNVLFRYYIHMIWSHTVPRVCHIIFCWDAMYVNGTHGLYLSSLRPLIVDSQTAHLDRVWIKTKHINWFSRSTTTWQSIMKYLSCLWIISGSFKHC